MTLADTVTTYTGNTPQTGDAYAVVNSGTFGNAAIKGYVDDIGVAGAGLTALGDARLANLDATVTSRMATYTQPTGFLAATFPGTLASTTNITAGTITTATNVTTVNSLSAAALAGFFTTDSTKLYADAVTGSVVKETASGAGGGGLTQADVRQAVGLATANLDTQLAGIPTNAENADKLLGRNHEGGADGGRTVSQCLAASRNKVAFEVPGAGQFTVYAADDTTPLWTGTYTRGATTLGPLTATDPA